MDLIVGLGNPGEEYERTRHNIGFAVADAIAAELGCSFKWGLGEFSIAISKRFGDGVVILKPKTYMNRSGGAVRTALRQHELDISRLIVIVDDFHLPLGSVRLREKGSAGGHNGLSSIIDHVGTNEFKRIRCGIAGSSMPADPSRTSDFVLGRFRKGEQEAVESMIQTARDAALLAVRDGFSKAMNTYNTRV